MISTMSKETTRAFQNDIENQSAVNNKHEPPSMMRGCVVVIIIILLFFVFAALIFSLFYWLAVTIAPDKELSFEVDSLGVNSLTISNDDHDHSDKHTLTATSLNLTLSMKVKKATKVESSLLVLVEYHGEIFTLTTVQPTVFQPTQNHSLLLEMDVVSSKQRSQVAIDSIAKDLASRNDLEFTVHAQGYNWSVQGYDAKYVIKLVCRGIKVRFPSSTTNITTSGSMINAPIHCNFDLDMIDSA